MTEPERAALDHIRRVVDSVIGEPTFPVPRSSEPGGINFLPVPYFSLLGTGADEVFNDSGAAVGAMLVRAYTGTILTPNDFFNQASQQVNASLTFTQISNALRINGVPVEIRSGLRLADLGLILLSGRPAIVMVKQTILQEAGLTQESFDGPYFLVAVGLDVKQIHVHDPLRKGASGQSQGIPWLTFYQAWTQAPGNERTALVPRMQLVRKVKVTTTTLNVHKQPNGDAPVAGVVNSGEVFEVTSQVEGWGKIGEDRWISLSYVAEI